MTVKGIEREDLDIMLLIVMSIVLMILSMA